MIPEYPGFALLGKGIQTSLPLRERCKWYVFGFYSFGLFGATLRALGQIVSGLPEDVKQEW